MGIEFGYYPYDDEVRSSTVSITPLGTIADVVAEVSGSEFVSDRWFYAPPQYVRGREQPRPYSTRVFGLHSTHRLEHTDGDDVQRLRFLMHCFGFFEGMRLDDTKAGFLDATPIVRGVLNDFALLGSDLSRALDFADEFWNRHQARPEIATTLLGVFQSLSLAQRPQSLAFEEFIYAYTALEGCFAVGRATHNVQNQGGHAARTISLCNALMIPVPEWLTNQVTVNAVTVRNNALHEGLFLQQPFGYASFHDMAVPERERHTTAALPAAMLNLVCRLLVALLGLRPEDYLRSSTYERAVFRLHL